ncbi:hypothetical protein JZ751_029136 [Albula glossodonta]|uniref:Uncharacterized protein n=1 Tax=Albula glossodonta TaxID=121402 RepID=A0A8T2P995_9TELE|nr:hypothetical protein JZ751_029136 [Albula glossodonta]
MTPGPPTPHPRSSSPRPPGVWAVSSCRSPHQQPWAAKRCTPAAEQRLDHSKHPSAQANPPPTASQQIEPPAAHSGPTLAPRWADRCPKPLSPLLFSLLLCWLTCLSEARCYLTLAAFLLLAHTT